MISNPPRPLPPPVTKSSNKMCFFRHRAGGETCIVFLSFGCPEINLDEVLSALLHSVQSVHLATHHLGHKL